jgi:hypothetical protein
LDARLDGAPIGVVGEAELVADTLHHALLELSRVEVTPTAPALPASASAIVVLCQETAGAQAYDSSGTPHY